MFESSDMFKTNNNNKDKKKERQDEIKGET